MNQALDNYLRNHLAGSATTLAVLNDLLHLTNSSELHVVLRRIRADMETDQGILQEFMNANGGTTPDIRNSTSRGDTRNFNLGHGGPAGLFEALEQLEQGIEAKRLMWRAIRTFAKFDPQLPRLDFAELETRAGSQHDELERWRWLVLRTLAELKLTEAHEKLVD